MAKVTYRGVSYDTDTRKQAAAPQKVEETYRGVSYDTNDKRTCQKEATVLTYRGIKHTESKTVCA